MQHGLRKHATYGGSGAYRWMICHGSVKLAEAAPPEQKDKYRDEGTAAHELLDRCLKERCFDASYGLAMYGYNGEPEWAEGIESGVQIALDYVLGILEAYEDAILFVEQEFNFPTMVDPDNSYGTTDVAIYVPSLNMLFIMDYKHGAGRVVEVVENKQLMFYGTGTVFTLFEQYPEIKDATVVLTVIQPRKPHKDGVVRPWVTTTARLMIFRDEVDAAIIATKSPTAPLVPGEAQCDFCPCKVMCPALELKAVQLARNNARSIKDIIVQGVPPPQSLTIERIVELLQAKDLIYKYLDAIEKFAYGYMAQGHPIPGYKLVESQARRKWFDKDNDDKNVAVALMRLAELDPADAAAWDKVYPRRLMTITAAENLVKTAFSKNAPKGKKKEAAQLANEALAALTLKESSGKHVMVEATDPRPALNRTDAVIAQIAAPPPANA